MKGPNLLVEPGLLPQPAEHNKVVVGQYRYVSAPSPIHWQNLDEGLLYIVNIGLIGIKTQNESLILSSGMLLYIPPHTEHIEQYMGLPMYGWIIKFPKNRAAGLPSSPRVYTAKKLVLEMAMEIISWGNLTIQEKSPQQKRFVDAFIDQLTIAPEGHHLPVTLPTSPSLLKVATAITNTINDKKSLEYWSKVSGMSRSSFTNRWKKETGLTFAIWRQRVKMQAAIRLLASGRSVNETSNELGFTSASAFGEVFSKQLGMSPTKFMNSKGNELSNYIQSHVASNLKK